MFKNLASIVIKFKGTIEMIPIKKSNVKIVKPKYNKTNSIPRVVECDDEYIKRIIKNGGL
tara:strand:- start:2463 stop:2642 length:180 start_codon:yes stop_codon:yes gene_type:complete